MLEKQLSYISCEFTCVYIQCTQNVYTHLHTLRKIANLLYCIFFFVFQRNSLSLSLSPSLMNEVVHTSPTIGSNVEEVCQ